MTTVLLRTAGSAVGGLIGGPAGAALGAGLAARGAKLFGAGSGSSHASEGPRLTSLAGLTSTEGAPIPRLYGRTRVGGQVIWTTRFEETATVTRKGSRGGKGGGGTQRTDYSYFANLAVGLCEGPITDVRRIWADGREIDRTLVTLRVHRGEETQAPDALIVAKEGAENAPAYRGLAYVVFERLPLADYGNRIPQLAFEVVRAIEPLASMIRGVNIIPGAGEYAYASQAVASTPDIGVTVSENRHQLVAGSDWTASIDALQRLCPKLESAALVVSWFGDDLRAGTCTIAPRVENTTKFVSGAPWSVAGIPRQAARAVSLHNGSPAYGGTPSDASVRAALADLKARGLAVTFYSFVMMDIPADNSLGQPAYPWRGRITCSSGADGTAQARTEIAAFFAQWRTMVLHNAQLCSDAGGVDTFVLGSELVGLTRLRDETDSYPAALALAALAREVRGILGPATKIGYSADWTEYGGQARNAGADLDFPLDVLWACEAVDFVGIDFYPPLSDWRDGTAHLDATQAASIYDRDYLLGRIVSGEGFDWYYANANERAAQQRHAIMDGAYGKPWCFRVKDLQGWWSNPHVERRNGKERASPTGWVPMSKPIRLMEVGCPAVDRGANGPNVFVDAKSSEGALPPFSRGFRDDLMQARAIEAVLTHYGDDATRNPRSPIYGGAMVDASRTHVWAWDARPFPAFPTCSTIWADSPNWELGHWLNGRLEGAGLSALVAALCRDLVPDLPAPDTSRLIGQLDGYALDHVLSAKAALEPLATMFGFDALFAGTSLRFVVPGDAPLGVTRDDLVPGETGALIETTRTADADLPRDVALTFSDGEIDYRVASVTSRRMEGAARGKREVELAAVLSRAQAQRLADLHLADLWMARDTLRLTLRRSLVAVEAGDCLRLDAEGVPRLLQVTRVVDGAGRKVEARAVGPTLHDIMPRVLPRSPVAPPKLAGPPHVEVLDLAVARDDGDVLQHVAVFADPWPGTMTLWRRQGASDFVEQGTLTRPATIGTLLDDLAPAPAGLFDRRNQPQVRLAGGSLASVEDLQLFAGRNLAALQVADGAWEIIGFAGAELVAPQTYRLSRLLRGLGGESHLCARSLPAGARFVLLDEAVVPLASGLSALGVAATYRTGPATRGFGDAAVTEFSATPGPEALLPYAPLRAVAARSAAGVTIRFLRRGRREADGWEAQDIPLGETSEAYRVTISRGGVPLRVITATTTSILYAAADEQTDFGAPQTSLEIQLQQLSATAGAGFPLQTTLLIS